MVAASICPTAEMETNSFSDEAVSPSAAIAKVTVHVLVAPFSAVTTKFCEAFHTLIVSGFGAIVAPGERVIPFVLRRAAAIEEP